MGNLAVEHKGGSWKLKAKRYMKTWSLLLNDFNVSDLNCGKIGVAKEKRQLEKHVFLANQLRKVWLPAMALHDHNANLSDDFQSDKASFLHMNDAFNFGRDL